MLAVRRTSDGGGKVGPPSVAALMTVEFRRDAGWELYAKCLWKDATIDGLSLQEKCAVVAVMVETVRFGTIF